MKFSLGSLKKIEKRKELFISKEIFQLSIEITRYEVAKYGDLFSLVLKYVYFLDPTNGFVVADHSPPGNLSFLIIFAYLRYFENS